MKSVVFAYSKQGMRTAERVVSCFEPDNMLLYAPSRLANERFSPIPTPSGNFYSSQFNRADALIFVGACGIAVRAIAPHVHSKQSDPAVLCIDELGKYVIPLLSGHIGGANEMAKLLAEKLDGIPVITTATDINNRFSVDTWAVQNSFLIDSMQCAKEISALILEQEIAVSSTLPISGKLPNGLINKKYGDAGIFIGWEIQEPYKLTLRLIPKILHLGIGCRKGTGATAIQDAVMKTLEHNHIDPRAVKCASTIDLKADEPGMLEYCRSADIPLHFYSAEDLLTVQGNFTHSDFVQKITGVDNVCERAAMIHADRLIIPKTVWEGVTIAIAAEKKEVCFE